MFPVDLLTALQRWIQLVLIVKPVLNEPALLLKGKHDQILCIADIHVGYEFALQQAGIRIPLQTKKLAEKILDLVRKTKAKSLIILGDVKHGVLSSSRRELLECKFLLEELSSSVTVKIVKGNHDVNLERVIPGNVVLHDSKGVLISDNVALLHGHAWPRAELLKADQIIIGHNHPVIEFKTSTGIRWTKPVWMEVQVERGKLALYAMKKAGRGDLASFNGSVSVMVMPAFNPLLGGLPVNLNTELLGPLLSSRIINHDDLSLTLLDGTYLGKISHLKGKKEASALKG